MNASTRLRVPRQDGAILAVPSLPEVGGLLEHNRQLLARATADVLGRPLTDLRRAARASVVAAAHAYLREAGEPVPAFPADSLVLAGHQPELFHPGVWVKNFALHGLARSGSATPLNLVVDNDTAKTNLLRVPVRSTSETVPAYHLESIPFDVWTGEVPYEDRTVRDEELFATLPERVAAVAQNWGFRPLLPAYWDEVRRQTQRTPLLGERFAAARRALERAWGCHNLELPVSRLCTTEPFAWFACHLLLDLPRFHALHNDIVHRYRRAHGIRSRNHPVPDLAAEGDWLEAPFWGWRTGAGQRGRLLARRTAEALELRVGAETWPMVPAPADRGAEATVAAWQDLQRRGFEVRTRALTTTLYARVFLGDLFIHGIGGGKYDELTDELIGAFHGLAAPAFLILSGTLLLPFERTDAGPDCRGLRGELRDLHWNPQRHLAPDHPAAAALSARKRELAGQARPGDRRARRAWFQALRAMTEELRPFVAGRAAALTGARERCERERQGRAVADRRDYAFCLYPEEVLRPFCTRLLVPGQ